MIVNNVTDKELELTLLELVSGEEFKVKILPHASTEIEKGFIVTSPDLSDTQVEEIIETEPEEMEEEIEEIIEPEEIEEEIVEETTEIPEEVVVESEPVPDKFICDICGQEFASQRSLSSHKSRVHKD